MGFEFSVFFVRWGFSGTFVFPGVGILTQCSCGLDVWYFCALLWWSSGYFLWIFVLGFVRVLTGVGFCSVLLCIDWFVGVHF